MGLFRSMRELRRQTKEIQRTWDPVAQMRTGMEQMQAATAALAHQNATAHLADAGVPGTAMVTAVRDTGTRFNGMPMVDLDLLVTVADRAPYPVNLRCTVPLTGLPQLAAGQRVAVRVDPGQPLAVAVMWAQVC